MDGARAVGQTAYGRLEAIFRRIALLGDARSLLHWDMAAMMPAGGAESRAEQLALLETLSHDMLVAPELPDLLDRAGDEGLEPWEQANLREMRRHWTHASALPTDLVEAVARAESACEMVWREARQKADFAMVRPLLGELLDRVRDKAQATADRLGLAPYDALLDHYEPGGRAAEIDPLFADLEAFLSDFIGRVLDRQRAHPAPLTPDGPFPAESQRAVGLEMMAALGFDFDHGRLDTSHHPFCGGTHDDVRLTTRYDEADFAKALMGVLHETGHALYDLGLPGGRWRGQPVADARGMVIHESQSLLIEMQVCRSRDFIAWAAPRLAKAFGGAGPAWAADNLYRLGIRVRPGFIRIDADEVTYPAHVIIRARLERALIAGDMKLDDLPAAWNESYGRLLGITPPDDGVGCLQDIHWYCGAWGYFPTYTLGAMSAAQLFDAARRSDPAIAKGVADGDFRPLLAWLRRHVHGRGSFLSTRALMTEATGRPLDPAVFKAHLQARYLDGA